MHPELEIMFGVINALDSIVDSTMNAFPNEIFRMILRPWVEALGTLATKSPGQKESILTQIQKSRRQLQIIPNSFTFLYSIIILWQFILHSNE